MADFAAASLGEQSNTLETFTAGRIVESHIAPTNAPDQGEAAVT